MFLVSVLIFAHVWCWTFLLDQGSVGFSLNGLLQNSQYHLTRGNHLLQQQHCQHSRYKNILKINCSPLAYHQWLQKLKIKTSAEQTVKVKVIQNKCGSSNGDGKGEGRRERAKEEQKQGGKGESVRKTVFSFQRNVMYLALINVKNSVSILLTLEYWL